MKIHTKSIQFQFVASQKENNRRIVCLRSHGETTKSTVEWNCCFGLFVLQKENLIE